MSYEIIIKTIGGERMLSCEGMSLLYGVPADEISTRLRTDPVMPAQWLQAGRRRVSEAAAAIGSRELFAVLEHLAGQRGQTVVEVES